MNSAWLAVSLIAAALLSWLRLIALDGDLARAEPKTLRYRVLHAAGKLVRGGRRRRLKIPASWPWAEAIATACTPDHRLAAGTLTSEKPNLRHRRSNPWGLWNPRPPARQPGHCHTSSRKIRNCSAVQPPSPASLPYA